MRPKREWTAALVFAMVLAGHDVPAQEQETGPSSPTPLSQASGFGVQDTQVVNIPFAAFVRATVDMKSRGETITGTPYSTLQVAPLQAGLVPNGAVIDQFAAYVRVDNNLFPITVELCRHWIDANGQNPGSDCPYSLTSSGTVGDGVLVDNSDLFVSYRYDVDGDGIDEVVSYTVWVTAEDDRYTALRQVRLLYHRQVSPAPLVASFGDVPTNHPEFQYIEALAAAGISAGCGNNQYCPDNPVTRAQLALFLAKALGLHWPAF